VVKLFVPKHAGCVAARSSSDKEKTWDALALQHRKHVSERVEETVVAGYENRAWRERFAMLNPGSKVVWADDLIMTLEELELPSKDFRLQQICIEKSFACGMVGRNNAMVVYDRAAAGWRDAVEPSDVMEGRIYDALQ
jgi:hypothetical protein